MFSPTKTFSIAKKYGIRLPKQRIFENESDARKFAEKIGYPVVMKVASSEHKTETGGVFTGIRKDGFSVTFRRLKKKSRHILVQKHIEGIETIVGGIRDAQFGSCVSFGTGGIFVEILKDINFRVCPLRKKDVVDLVKESDIYQILKGYRGKKYDIESVYENISAVSNIMENEKVDEMDINPLICNSKGAWAVDVRMG